MRTLQDHQVVGAATSLTITVTDEPGSGGAHHRYEITGFDTTTNPSGIDSYGYKTSYSRQVILFQNGPVPTNGVNGLTQEALLAVSADRLRCFQAGPFASDDNAEALIHIEAALECLHRRTRNRIARDVEGKEVA